MEHIVISKELKKKTNNELNKCTGCKLCMKNCSMLNEFCDSPKELLRNIANEGKIEAIIPYSCSLCGYCKQVCPKSVDLKSVFLDIRKEIVDKNDEIFKSIKTNSITFHQKSSFSKLFTTSIKKSKDYTKKRVFFPGCSLTSYSPDIVMKTYQYLKENGEIDIILKCCGNPTYSIGDNKKFNYYYKNLQKDFEKLNVDEVIVACQNCFKTIKNNSPNIKVKSLYEEIAEIGVPKDKENIGKEIDITFAIHDPCPTRNESVIHESIREITKQLNLNIEELEYSREKTLCCGSGGMVLLTNSEIALNQMKKRANQANLDCILTYCEECVESMKRGGKRSIHILDLLFNDEIYMNEFNQKELNTMNKWVNRYKAKRRIDRLINNR